MARGVHYKEIASELNLPVSTLYQIAKNPFYLGKIQYKKKLYRGNHSAIVDEKLFYSVNSPPEKQQLSLTNYD